MANKKDGTLQPVGPADYSAGTEIGHDVDEVALQRSNNQTVQLF